MKHSYIIAVCGQTVGARNGQSVQQQGYGRDDQGCGFDFRQGKRFSPHSVQTGSGAHPASHALSTGDWFPWVKQQRLEAGNTFHSSVWVKNGGAILHSPIVPSWHKA
jgi:hypothetical protein